MKKSDFKQRMSRPACVPHELTDVGTINIAKLSLGKRTELHKFFQDNKDTTTGREQSQFLLFCACYSEDFEPLFESHTDPTFDDFREETMEELIKAVMDVNQLGSKEEKAVEDAKN